MGDVSLQLATVLLRIYAATALTPFSALVTADGACPGCSGADKRSADELSGSISRVKRGAV